MKNFMNMHFLVLIELLLIHNFIIKLAGNITPIIAGHYDLMDNYEPE